MGCLQSSAPQTGTSLKHVQTQSGAAVYISNDEAAQYTSATWQYLEDINTGNWRAYNPNNSRQISVAYNTHATKCQISNQNGEAFELDFQRMTETNVVNGWQRKIRIQPTNAHNHNHGHNPNLNTFSSSTTKSISPNLHSPHNKAQQPSISSYTAHTVSPKHQNDINPLLVQHDVQNEHKKQHQHQHSSHHYKWQWFSESIGWKDYDDKLSAKIDEAYTENIARYAFKIRSNNTKYEIDFDHMKQSNLDTNKLRIIRRVKRDQVAAMNGYDGNVNEERFVWEFFNDLEGVWYEYGDNVSLKIETVHHSNAAVARMKIHGVEFEIRLNEMPMNQMSLKTGKISQIRRVVKSGQNKRISTMKKNVIGASNDMLKPQSQIKKFQWRYKEMFNVWKVYPGQINTKIENAFRAELERYSFQMNGHEFEIQFNFLRMVNLQTNETNQIARIDNLAKNRSPSMFNQPAAARNGNKNNYNHGVTHSMNVAGMGDNVQRKDEFGKKKKKHVARSYTVDMGSANANAPGLDNNFNLLIKQQQKAMKYFNKQHEKKKSSMSLNLKNEFNPDINIIHKNAQIEQKNEELDDFVWKYKNDDGTWSSYSQQLNNQIENAHQDGQYTIEIEKNGIFYQIKFEHNLECHFATNKMRSIQRVQLNNGVPQIQNKRKVKSVEINQEFDALSNNLESVKHAKNMLSDYDEHDAEEKDEQFTNNTPQIPMNNDNDSDESDESESYSQEDSDESEEDEDEEESDVESEEDEAETESEEEQEFQGTPASQVALKDYGNDYNEYMQKFQNLKKV